MRTQTHTHQKLKKGKKQTYTISFYASLSPAPTIQSISITLSDYIQIPKYGIFFSSSLHIYIFMLQAFTFCKGILHPRSYFPATLGRILDSTVKPSGLCFKKLQYHIRVEDCAWRVERD